MRDPINTVRRAIRGDSYLETGESLSPNVQVFVRTLRHPMALFFIQKSPARGVILLTLLMAFVGSSVGTGCTFFGEGSRGRPAQNAQMAQNLEYLRVFSRDQQECLKAKLESSPNWGAHKEALDYGDFLEERVPRVLRIVEESLPPKQRRRFVAERVHVDAKVRLAEEMNEMKAAENEGGTLARQIRHEGTKVPMQVRVASLLPWTNYLPAPLQVEVRAICKRTASD